MKLFKWYIIVPVILLVTIGVIYAFKNGQSSENERDAVRYKEFVVERGTFSTMVSASGVVRPIDRIEVKSKASGLIETMPVEEGDLVRKGDLICRLDQTDIQAEVDQAQADLDIAKAEYTQAENTFGRRQQLFEKKLISQEERDEADLAVARAKGNLIRAQTKLDQANVRLSETIVRSPIDGVILQKYVEPGQIIASGISNVGGGTAIADVADMRFVYVEAGIDEIDVGKIRVGQSAKVVAEAYPQMKFDGSIIRIAPEARVDQNVTLFDVIVEVANTDARLKSGMNATVEINIESEKDVLLVPVMALSPVDQPGAPRNVRTALVREGEEFAPRQVTIGLSNFKQAVVEEGLAEGDILGVPMTSRLKADNDRLEQRIKSSRSFGASSSSSDSSKKKGGR
jgi:HlyD family secretion protein